MATPGPTLGGGRGPSSGGLLETILNRIRMATERGAVGQEKLTQMLRNSPLIRTGMAAATGVAGAATGLAMRGFSGTVEMNRLQLETQMISRELAGAFKPAVDFATKALMGFRKGLERLGEREQNMILLAGLTFGGLGAVGLARMGLRGLGGMTGGLIGGGGIGTPLAIGGIAAAAGYRNEAIGGAAAYGALRGGLRGAARTAGPVALGAIGYEASTGGYYSELRRRGNSKFTAGLGSIGGGFMDLLSFGAYGDAFRKRYGSGDAASGGPNPDRRMVTLADAGFDRSGAAFERISNRLSLTEANNAGKDSATLLEDIKRFLETTFGSGKAPPPPPMPN